MFRRQAPTDDGRHGRHKSASGRSPRRGLLICAGISAGWMAVDRDGTRLASAGGRHRPTRMRYGPGLDMLRAIAAPSRPSSSTRTAPGVRQAGRHRSGVGRRVGMRSACSRPHQLGPGGGLQSRQEWLASRALGRHHPASGRPPVDAGDSGRWGSPQASGRAIRHPALGGRVLDRVRQHRGSPRCGGSRLELAMRRYRPPAGAAPTNR